MSQSGRRSQHCTKSVEKHKAKGVSNEDISQVCTQYVPNAWIIELLHKTQLAGGDGRDCYAIDAVPCEDHSTRS